MLYSLWLAHEARPSDRVSSSNSSQSIFPNLDKVLTTLSSVHHSNCCRPQNRNHVCRTSSLQCLSATGFHGLRQTGELQSISVQYSQTLYHLMLTHGPGTCQASKVTVLGASGGIGQPLSLLMKLNPRVTELALYDIRGGPGPFDRYTRKGEESDERVS